MEIIAFFGMLLSVLIVVILAVWLIELYDRYRTYTARRVGTTREKAELDLEVRRRVQEHQATKARQLAFDRREAMRQRRYRRDRYREMREARRKKDDT